MSAAEKRSGAGKYLAVYVCMLMIMGGLTASGSWLVRPLQSSIDMETLIVMTEHEN